MKTEFEFIELVKNETDHRFELHYNNAVAFIDYKEMGNQTALIHTEAPKQLQGTGAASALVEKTLAHLKAQQRTVLPFCPYVLAYIKKHSEWKEIVHPSFTKYDEI